MVIACGRRQMDPRHKPGDDGLGNRLQRRLQNPEQPLDIVVSIVDMRRDAHRLAAHADENLFRRQLLGKLS
jgi:hypothetical protein